VSDTHGPPSEGKGKEKRGKGREGKEGEGDEKGQGSVPITLLAQGPQHEIRPCRNASRSTCNRYTMTRIHRPISAYNKKLGISYAQNITANEIMTPFIYA